MTDLQNIEGFKGSLLELLDKRYPIIDLELKTKKLKLKDITEYFAYMNYLSEEKLWSKIKYWHKKGLYPEARNYLFQLMEEYRRNTDNQDIEEDLDCKGTFEREKTRVSNLIKRVYAEAIRLEEEATGTVALLEFEKEKELEEQTKSSMNQFSISELVAFFNVLDELYRITDGHTENNKNKLLQKLSGYSISKIDGKNREFRNKKFIESKKTQNAYHSLLELCENLHLNIEIINKIKDKTI